ncbi:MAG: DUF1553 domain-containing protein, partial [Bacteroidota bacterium]
SKPAEGLSAGERSALIDYYFANYSSNYQEQTHQLYLARRALVDSVENVQEVMVMKEMEAPRPAYVLDRGVYDNYGEAVYPGTPNSILPWKDDLPKNRLGLARWLFDEDHPLTARVAVNRYWQNYFGRGIVRTTEDFGNQGELPSHPQLLDWLAFEFVASGWDIKALQKLIVMSASYRQSSLGKDDLMEADPDNLWIARGPQTRLSSEMVRDNALVASGLINQRIGGESIRPYQPEGLWAMNSDTYVQDTGEDLYRRSLYVIWKRTVPHPTLQTFDQPERTQCTVRRQKTNTPLQALVLLNDPTYVEVAKVLGELITASNNEVEGITKAYRRLTGRLPTDEEIRLLVELKFQQLNKFKAAPDKASGWLNAGEYALDDDLEKAEVAANAVVASVIINSDATITKR